MPLFTIRPGWRPTRRRCWLSSPSSARKRLIHLFTKCNALNATIASNAVAERQFLIVKVIFRATRATLSDANFERLRWCSWTVTEITLKCWRRSRKRSRSQCLIRLLKLFSSVFLFLTVPDLFNTFCKVNTLCRMLFELCRSVLRILERKKSKLKSYK